jgi:hypothetical protein
MFSARSKSINTNLKNDNTIANLLTPSDLIDGRLAKVDLTQIKTNIVSMSPNFEIGNIDHVVKTIHVSDINLVGDIVPSGNLVSNLGGPNNWFGNIYVNHAIMKKLRMKLRIMSMLDYHRWDKVGLVFWGFLDTRLLDRILDYWIGYLTPQMSSIANTRHRVGILDLSVEYLTPRNKY